MSITCEIGSIEDVLLIDSQMTEFCGTVTLKSIKDRLQNKNHLILIAKFNGELAGYKIGYQLTNKEFYSWLGAVSPDCRKLGIASALRKYQENWVLNSGYSLIRVKSMNRFSAMLHLLIASDYKISGYEDNGSIESSKIHFIKELKN